MKEIGVVKSIFSSTKKLKNNNIKKLINEVQKKTKQNRKNKKMYFMPKSIECAHRKCEKVNTHKKKQIHTNNKTELVTE